MVASAFFSSYNSNIEEVANYDVSFRCLICGDSKKNLNKKRMYFKVIEVIKELKRRGVKKEFYKYFYILLILVKYEEYVLLLYKGDINLNSWLFQG